MTIAGAGEGQFGQCWTTGGAAGLRGRPALGSGSVRGGGAPSGCRSAPALALCTRRRLWRLGGEGGHLCPSTGVADTRDTDTSAATPAEWNSNVLGRPRRAKSKPLLSILGDSSFHEVAAVAINDWRVSSCPRHVVGAETRMLTRASKAATRSSRRRKARSFVSSAVHAQSLPGPWIISASGIALLPGVAVSPLDWMLPDKLAPGASTWHDLPLSFWLPAVSSGTDRSGDTLGGSL
mmetsp:Transcript_46495/g.144083  ORF Transcript_46495/g.144083 Transcript_46495/m.144083 type:complete len:236 (+) Transcript_46495:439-1146(+)